MANAAGVNQSGLSGIRNNYTAMNNGNGMRDRLMEQQYVMPSFNWQYNNGGQNPALGRYRPPMMGKGGGWQDMGGYSYNLPNSFGPYYGAPMSGFYGGGGIPPWMQGAFIEPGRPGLGGARPKPAPAPSMFQRAGGSISLPPPTQRPMTVPATSDMFGNMAGPITTPTADQSARLTEILNQRRLFNNMPIFGR